MLVLLRYIYTHTLLILLVFDFQYVVNSLVYKLQDQFDCIDLSDNEIVKLENFPYLSRLGILLLNNNRITRINANIGGKQGFTVIVIFCLNLRRFDEFWF